MSSAIGLALILLLPTVMIVGAVCQRRWEKRVWNGGVCAENGLPWVPFDVDSQGGRGYVAGDRYCWISYKVDRPREAP